jgi:hypothetical protein
MGVDEARQERPLACERDPSVRYDKSVELALDPTAGSGCLHVVGDKLRKRERGACAYMRYSRPSSFHFLSTRALVLSSIRISSGQGRLKPSLGHLRVASMPIFEP